MDMANLKGRLHAVDVAGNGTAVKLRILDGGKESTVTLDRDDLAALARRLVEALAAANLDHTIRPSDPPRFSRAPLVIKASDVNVTWREERDSASVETVDAQGQRCISVLTADQMAFLASTIPSSGTAAAMGRKPH